MDHKASELAMRALLQKGAIYRVQNSREVGNIRGVQQTFRPVVNLWPLNKYHFKIEGMHIVKDFLRNMHISWCPSIQTIASTRGVGGGNYQFTCLPFGLASAPRVFIKMVKPVMAFLSRRGTRCVTFLNDLLMIMQGENSQQETRLALSPLEALGLMNYPKL